MKLLSLITVVVLMQVSVISQAAEMSGVAIQKQNSPAQIDKTNITNCTPAAGINVQAIGTKRVTKTNWGTTIVKRKLHLRDGIFSLTSHSTKLYS
jgi:hypothetical protein